VGDGRLDGVNDLEELGGPDGAVGGDFDGHDERSYPAGKQNPRAIIAGTIRWILGNDNRILPFFRTRYAGTVRSNQNDQFDY
jgi:hypothetical protein